MPRPLVEACWIMMYRLQAEEAMQARGAATHPYLDQKDQRSIIRDLQRAAGTAQPPKKATRADLEAIGIRTRKE